MTIQNQVRSLKAFAEFFAAIGKEEDAANARKWAAELEGRSSQTRMQKVRRFTKADAIRAHALGIRLD